MDRLLHQGLGKTSFFSAGRHAAYEHHADNFDFPSVPPPLSQDLEISPNPDFSSILNVHGKIFAVTQFESPRPGVAYLTELEQDDHGHLHVSHPSSVFSCVLISCLPT